VTSRRRFVFVQPHLRFGGAESQTVAICNALVERGHHCTVILHRRVGGLLERLDERVVVSDLGFESHLSVFLGARRALQQLRALPPSVVIVRLWSSVLMVGSIAHLMPQHRVHYYEDLDPRDHAEFIRFGRLKQSLIRFVFRRSQGRLIANTRHVSEAMRDAYGLDADPPVILCGIDSAQVREAAGPRDEESSEPAEVLRVTTIGSLVERKGLFALYEGLVSLRRPIEWTLVGEGPLRSWLTNRASSHPELRINLTGGMANPYPYIRNADLLLHGAISESFGVVILEALALGVPVVANGANGPREIATRLPDAPIRIFDADKPGSLAAAMSSVSRRPVGDIPVTDLGPFELRETVVDWEALSDEQSN
jgi:glycosyltransferase involved in cell wall biosynthesis